MRADAALTVLLPAARIYPPKVPAKPTWPFVRYGTAFVVPDRATCHDGIKLRVTISAFSKNANGEDEASNIAAALAKALDGAQLAIEGGHDGYVTWLGGQTVQDPEEAGGWHAWDDFEVLVVSAA